MSYQFKNLHVDQGDDKTYLIAVTNSDGPVDITGSTFTLIVKVSVTDPDGDAIITELNPYPTDGPAGLSFVKLTSSDTSINEPGMYPYRIKWVDANGNVTTVVRGELTIEAI